LRLKEKYIKYAPMRIPHATHQNLAALDNADPLLIRRLKDAQGDAAKIRAAVKGVKSGEIRRACAVILIQDPYLAPEILSIGTLAKSRATPHLAARRIVSFQERFSAEIVRKAGMFLRTAETSGEGWESVHK